MDNEWRTLFLETLERDQTRISRNILEYPHGVTKDELKSAEHILGFELPSELQSLLMEFDGIHEYVIQENGEKLQTSSIIWNLAEIVDWHISWTVPNQRNLLCFGNSALANSFGYLLENGKARENEIWQSDHE